MTAEPEEEKPTGKLKGFRKAKVTTTVLSESMSKLKGVDMFHYFML